MCDPGNLVLRFVIVFDRAATVRPGGDLGDARLTAVLFAAGFFFPVGFFGIAFPLTLMKSYDHDVDVMRPY